jgi:hypothetical protein
VEGRFDQGLIRLQDFEIKRLGVRILLWGLKVYDGSQEESKGGRYELCLF